MRCAISRARCCGHVVLDFAGRFGDTRDLAHELPRRRIDLLGRRGRLEAAELGDVPAHGTEATGAPAASDRLPKPERRPRTVWELFSTVVAATYTFTEHDLHAVTDDELAVGAELSVVEWAEENPGERPPPVDREIASARSVPARHEALYGPCLECRRHAGRPDRGAISTPSTTRLPTCSASTCTSTRTTAVEVGRGLVDRLVAYARSERRTRAHRGRRRASRAETTSRCIGGTSRQPREDQPPSDRGRRPRGARTVGGRRPAAVHRATNCSLGKVRRPTSTSPGVRRRLRGHERRAAR